jgi:hypothetical protein
MSNLILIPKRAILTFLVLTIVSVCYSQKVNVSDADKARIESQYKVNSWYDLSEYGYVEVKQNGKSGLLDKNLKLALPCKYDHIHLWMLEDYGYIEVVIDDKCGVLDKNLHVIFPCEFQEIYKRDDCGGYYEAKKDGKTAIFDLSGKMLFGYKYDEVYWYQREDNDGCDVKLNGKVGYIDKSGKEIIPCRYDDIRYSPEKVSKEPFAEVKLNGKCGIYDIKHHEELSKIEYDETWYSMLNDGDRFCKVVVDNKKGVFDSQTRSLVVPTQYDDVSIIALNDGYCKQMRLKVEKDSLFGVYDVKKEKEILPCRFTQIFYLDEIGLDSRYTIVCLGGKYVAYHYEDHNLVGNYFETQPMYGVYSTETGAEVLPCKYEYLEYAGEDMFLFNVGGQHLKESFKFKPIGGLWGVVDSNGKEICKAEYLEIEHFKDGVAKTVKDGVASILVNPNSGTKLLLANGVSPCAIDNNIPTITRQNDETFAFIFANENYAHFSGSDFSINDGLIFKKYCQQTLGLPESNIRYFEDATYGNIMSALKKMQDIADVYDGDAKIIFYFSGLGNSEDDERYILPSDASPATIKTTGISVNSILSALNALNTQYTLALFDAPFNGTDKSGKMLASARGVKIKAKTPQSEGKTIAVFGSSDDKNTYCDDKNGHGLLTYTILEQIQQSKGECSLKTLIDSSTKAVEKSSLSLFKDVQSPLVIIPESMQVKWSTIKL